MPPLRTRRTPSDAQFAFDTKQISYLLKLGHNAGEEARRDRTVWWRRYFAQTGLQNRLIPQDAWEDPGYDISNPLAYKEAVAELQKDLLEAKVYRGKWQQLMQDGLFPPNLDLKHPYLLPQYFEWWQAENIYRRGFMKAYEDYYIEVFKDELKKKFSASGNVLTIKAMEDLASRDDPYMTRYFRELIEAQKEGKTQPFNSLKDLYTDLLAKREYAYQQFSPYFHPLRWVGGGLTSIEPENMR